MNNELGEMPEITRFFKGVGNEKPQKAKYSKTWDPHTILTFISDWFPNDTLSLEKLTEKLVTLLALVKAQRVQTLSKIKLNNIHETETEIKIKITDKIKTSNRLREQPIHKIPFFIDQESVCPAQKLYMII